MPLSGIMLGAGVCVWVLVGKFSFPRGIQTEDDISVVRRRWLGVGVVTGAILVLAGVWSAFG